MMDNPCCIKSSIDIPNQKDFLLSWEVTIICWTDQLSWLTSLNDQLKPLVTTCLYFSHFHEGFSILQWRSCYNNQHCSSKTILESGSNWSELFCKILKWLYLHQTLFCHFKSLFIFCFVTQTLFLSTLSGDEIREGFETHEVWLGHPSVFRSATEEKNRRKVGWVYRFQNVNLGLLIMLLIIVIIVIYDLHRGIFHHAVTVNNHPLKLFTWGPDAWKKEYIVFIHERRN